MPSSPARRSPEREPRHEAGVPEREPAGSLKLVESQPQKNEQERLLPPAEPAYNGDDDFRCDDEDDAGGLGLELHQDYSEHSSSASDSASDEEDSEEDEKPISGFNVCHLGSKKDFMLDSGMMVFEPAEETAGEALARLQGKSSAVKTNSGGVKWWEQRLATGKKSIMMSRDMYNRLHNHQVEAVLWMLGLRQEGQGGILADEMGMGKTISICAYLHTLKKSNIGSRHVLVLAPKSLLPQWEQACRDWSVEYQVVTINEDTATLDDVHTRKIATRISEISRKSSGGILLINYEKLQRHLRYLKDVHWVKDDAEFADGEDFLGDGVTVDVPRRQDKFADVDDELANADQQRTKAVKEKAMKSAMKSQKGSESAAPPQSAKNPKEPAASGDAAPVPVVGKKRVKYASKPWDLVVLDEGHKLKNQATEIFSLVSQIKSRQTMCLSGTPVQNNLRELYNLMNLVTKPEKRGQEGFLRSYSFFKRHFQEPIRVGNFADADDDQVEKKTRRARELKRLIKPYLLHRKKDLLPPDSELQVGPGLVAAASSSSSSSSSSASKVINAAAAAAVDSGTIEMKKQGGFDTIKHEVLVWVPVKEDGHQVRRYRDILDSREARDARDAVEDGESATSPSVLPILVKLRQTSTHPVLSLDEDEQLWKADDFEDEGDEEVLNQSPEGLVESSGKLQVVQYLVDQWRKEKKKFLIFSEFKSVLDLIQYAVLNPKHFRCERIDGGVTKERSSIVRSFQDPASRLEGMLLTTGVGGLGLNLTAASRVLIIDSDWKPATDSQAIARVFRQGQKEKHVIAYRLFSMGLVDEHMFLVNRFKQSMISAAFESENQTRHVDEEALAKCFDVGRSPPVYSLCEEFDTNKKIRGVEHEGPDDVNNPRGEVYSLQMKFPDLVLSDADAMLKLDKTEAVADGSAEPSSDSEDAGRPFRKKRKL